MVRLEGCTWESAHGPGFESWIYHFLSLSSYLTALHLNSLYGSIVFAMIVFTMRFLEGLKKTTIWLAAASGHRRHSINGKPYVVTSKHVHTFSDTPTIERQHLCPFTWAEAGFGIFLMNRMWQKCYHVTSEARPPDHQVEGWERRREEPRGPVQVSEWRYLRAQTSPGCWHVSCFEDVKQGRLWGWGSILDESRMLHWSQIFKNVLYVIFWRLF